MRCRAWETEHQNGKKYVHVVDESLSAEVVKEIAERLAGSPCTNPMLRDIVGSYLLAGQGHEAIGFSSFVELDRNVVSEIQSVSLLLNELKRRDRLYADALCAIIERLGLEAEEEKGARQDGQ